jgi:threonyl-tRNA synthetase
MEAIIKKDIKITRKEIPVSEAKKLFKGNEYKHEWLEEREKNKEPASVYWTGDEFVDLCAGPHVPSTGKVGVIKLLRIAGAYWRGDSKNKMLQRIYGVAFHDKKELNAYLELLEEAKKRDHKKLGKELDLFVFSDLVGPGLPLWTPKGTLLRNLLDEYIWQLREERGYKKVCIPHITKKELYETSGHWAKFSNDLFKTVSREGHMFALKPMNCPHHTQIFASSIRSYRDMPHRYAETTMCYRDEQTGELSGLSRLRGFTQDDAHVFCRISQIKEEFLKIWDIVDTFYPKFGFQLKVRLSLHDPNNMKAYLGTPELWKKSEGVLRELAKEKKVNFFEAIGEAAFYGPKIDFITKDSLNREWQVATIQLDMNMPERFDLYCVNEKGEQERVAMIHAAIMGSIERFLSVLIEHLAGKFPLWLSPVQVRIMTVANTFDSHAEKIMKKFSDAKIRVELDNRSESIPKKVRDAQLEKVPLMLTIGEKEVANDTVAVRTLDGQVKFGVKTHDLIEKVKENIEKRELKFAV